MYLKKCTLAYNKPNFCDHHFKFLGLFEKKIRHESMSLSRTITQYTYPDINTWRLRRSITKSCPIYHHKQYNNQAHSHTASFVILAPQHSTITRHWRDNWVELSLKQRSAGQLNIDWRTFSVSLTIFFDFFHYWNWVLNYSTLFAFET